MQPVEPANKRWLSLSAAAKKLNIHPATLRRWADDGAIPVILTPGGHRRFAVADLERFAQPRRGSGAEEVWAQQALTVVRQEIGTKQDANWMAALSESERQKSRTMGRHLMGLTLQYISNDSNDHLLTDAHQIGLEYGRHCYSLNMSLSDALNASLFFRDTMVETALQLPENVHIRPEANLRLLRQINTLLNTVHLAIAEVYDAHKNSMSGV